MHCDLWPFDLKIYRAHPCLMGSLHVKFHDDRCKGKAVMRRKPFSVIYALWPWPLDLKIYRAHPWLIGSLHVKFHDDRCKGKAVMRRKPFSVIYELWPWPLDLKIYRANPCLMGSLHVKFHDDRCKGKPKCGRTGGGTDGRTDRRTDRRTWWFQYTPPNFVAGGIMTIYVKSMVAFTLLHRLSVLSFSFCLIKATRLKICKKSVCF